MIRGSVDVVTPKEVSGWAYAPDSREPVQVQVLLNHEILGETIANIHRSDLAAAGLGNGNSGFTIHLFRQIDPLYLPFLVVKMNGGDAELPRAPTLGFKDFFNSLYVTHPTAGRQRSVFGGLWTDRTDAAALLRGKVEIGQLSTETARTIEKLIYSGLSIIHLQSMPERSDWSRSSGDQVGDLLEEPSVLLPLRAILEDNPLVVETEVIEQPVARLTQPSSAAPSTSPAECLEIVVALSEGVVLEVVRESHRLPDSAPAAVRVGPAAWAMTSGMRSPPPACWTARNYPMARRPSSAPAPSTGCAASPAPRRCGSCACPRAVGQYQSRSPSIGRNMSMRMVSTFWFSYDACTRTDRRFGKPVNILWNGRG